MYVYTPAVYIQVCTFIILSSCLCCLSNAVKFCQVLVVTGVRCRTGNHEDGGGSPAWKTPWMVMVDGRRGVVMIATRKPVCASKTGRQQPGFHWPREANLQ